MQSRSPSRQILLERSLQERRRPRTLHWLRSCFPHAIKAVSIMLAKWFTAFHSTLVLISDHAYVQDKINSSKAQPANGEPAGPKKARKAAPIQVCFRLSQRVPYVACQAGDSYLWPVKNQLMWPPDSRMARMLARRSLPGRSQVLGRRPRRPLLLR